MAIASGRNEKSFDTDEAKHTRHRYPLAETAKKKQRKAIYRGSAAIVRLMQNGTLKAARSVLAEYTTGHS